MKTAKLFKHGGSQAVRLPKAFRLPGTEVTITRQGDDIVLSPRMSLKLTSLADVARHMATNHPTSAKFPARAQPVLQQERDLAW